MNLTDLRETVFRAMGETDTDNIPDHIFQLVTDNLNESQDEIYANLPFAWWMVREGTITPVTGTEVYELNPFAVKPLSFYTSDTNAHKVEFLHPRDADRDGFRNSNLSPFSLGPYHLTWTPKTTAAYSSGAAGASAGASVSEGATTVTKSGGTAWATGDVGKQIRLNGERADFTIASRNSDNSIELNRPYRARLRGNGITNAGSGLTQALWEVNPAGIYQVQIFQTQTNGPTINYRYQKRHSVLVNPTDVPEMPPEWHYLIAYGALLRMAEFVEKGNLYQMYVARYLQGLERLKATERMEFDMERVLRYESPTRLGTSRQRIPGQYFRGYPRGMGY